MSGLTRVAFEDAWKRLDDEAEASKFSQQALLRLFGFYRGLDTEDQRVADEALVAWLADGNARQRFDALALVDKFEIRSALPSLRAPLSRLRDDQGASVPYDRAKVERIISHLE